MKIYRVVSSIGYTVRAHVPDGYVLGPHLYAIAARDTVNGE